MPKTYMVRTLILRVLAAVSGLLGYLSFASAVFVLGAQALLNVRNLEKYWLLQDSLALQRRLARPAIEYLHAHAPWSLGGRDMAPFILGAALAALWLLCEAALHRFRVMRLALAARHDREVRQEAASLDKPEDHAGRLAAEADADPTHRGRLLEVYAKTKKILDEQKKNLSFLAVDVVDSTGLKRGEDPALAERDFRQYRKLLERIIEANKGLKTAWTPDGVMICFASVQSAVQTAQELIRGLEHFNSQVKTIKGEFKVRCGINAGSVLFDDSVRMEEMSDHHIDLAGHMQKYADANTIYIGAHAIEGMRVEHGFRPAQKEVDGCEVYEWRADPSGEAVPVA